MKRNENQLEEAKSLESARTMLGKKIQTKRSLQGFSERNKGQRIGIQINFFNGPEHVCVGISHPEDVESMTTKVLDIIDTQIEYFEKAIDKLTKKQ